MGQSVRVAAMSNLLNVLRAPTGNDARACEARLQLVIDTLPLTIVANPGAVVVACMALYFGRADLGVLPWWQMAAAFAVQVIASVGVLLVWRSHPSVHGHALPQVRRRLMLMQTLVGLSWGGVAWSLWVDGNAANNGFVVIIMAMALWAMTLTRCAVRSVFLCGLVSLTVPLTLRYATAAGDAAYVYFALVPLWMIYMIASAQAARTRVDGMLASRFANEDLSRQLAAARDEAVRKAEEAETTSKSKTAFLANMSHELRTPLNAIIGFSEIIASQALGPNNPRYPEYAGDILSSGTHLLGLINEILDVAKIEAGRMEIDPRPLDVAATFAAVERIMAVKAAQKALNISYRVDPGAGEIVADERAVRQILLNLVSNAVKFTPAGGAVTITAAPAEGGVAVSVADNGPGIAADKLALLFKPFCQINNRFDQQNGGTGLGLALVQGLIGLHGGRADIDSLEGAGTCVSVYFPLVPVKPALKRLMQ